MSADLQRVALLGQPLVRERAIRARVARCGAGATTSDRSDERDDHLKSQAYLDVGKLATATITIENVKPTAGTTYAADATVAAHGMTKTYPVTFDVIDTKDDRIRIKAQHTFPRLDFGIGTDPAQSSEEQVGTDVTIQMVLTLVRT